MNKKYKIKKNIKRIKEQLYKHNPDYDTDAYLGIDSVSSPEYLTLKKQLEKLEQKLQAKTKTVNDVPF